MIENTLLRAAAVMDMTGLRRSTLYAQIAAGDFPAPVSISKRCVAWHSHDVASWIANRQPTTFSGEA